MDRMDRLVILAAGALAWGGVNARGDGEADTEENAARRAINTLEALERFSSERTKHTKEAPQC